MSPEQCLGAPVDMRSDIFALGILLYELCTGKRLFKHESELMILEMITKRSVVPPSQVAPGISTRLEEVIMTALEKTVEARYQTAQDMQIALEDYLREDDRASTNADIAAYMRILFDDKIEEKRLLREAASRDDFESNFGDEEPTEQAAPTQPGNRRKVVHGLPPSQVRVLPTARTPPGPGMGRPMSAQMMPMGYMPPGGVTPQGQPMGLPGQTPLAFSHGAYPPGGPGMPGMTYPGGGLSQYGQSISGGVPVEGSGIVAKLVIGCALLVIIVASTILYQQLVRTETPTIANAAAVQVPSPVKTGKLLLDSQPPGAAIFLDDRPMMLDTGDQARTPSDLTSLQYGVTYRIRLVVDGYEPFLQDVKISTDNSTVRPRLIAKPGKLVAEVAGPHARDVRIFFNNTDVGPGPKVEKQFDANEVVFVQAKIPGLTCVADPSRLRIGPGKTIPTTIRCEAGLHEKTAASSEERASRGPTGQKATPVASHAQKPPRTENHESAATAETGPKKALEGPAGCKSNPNLPAGFITVDTKPVSDIYMGGAKIGQTPLAKYRAPAGCVEIKAVTADGKTRVEHLNVEPNKVMIYRFDVK
jgi:hypothetical protein